MLVTRYALLKLQNFHYQFEHAVHFQHNHEAYGRRNFYTTYYDFAPGRHSNN